MYLHPHHFGGTLDQSRACQTAYPVKWSTLTAALSPLKYYSTMLLTRASPAYDYRAELAAPCPRHVCPGPKAYHMPTHVKSLSRHKILGGSWITGLSPPLSQNVHGRHFDPFILFECTSQHFDYPTRNCAPEKSVKSFCIFLRYKIFFRKHNIP